MRPTAFCASLLVATALTFPCPSFAEPLDDAYRACVAKIRNSLTPTSSRDHISFDARAKQNWSDGDEFYFSWRSGLIVGATRSKPDHMTGSMKPSASCIGSLSTRQIRSISVNGDDVIPAPISY